MSDSDRPASAASEGAPDEGAPDEGAPPVLRVVTPDATPEEVAALVAVFAALGSGGEEPPRRRTPEWSAPHRGVRRTHPHGPGGWRSSGMPR